LELGLQADRMSETEVALRLAAFILSLPHSGAMAGVAVEAASIKIGDVIDASRSGFESHRRG
jgi:hypothetical protein